MRALLGATASLDAANGRPVATPLGSRSAHRQVHDGEDPRFGVVEGAEIAVVTGDPLYTPIQFTGQRVPLDDARLLAPVIPRSKVVGIGRNYAEHAAELGNEVPTEPLIFLKPNTSVVGPGDPIVLPAGSERVDYEGELAVVIGRVCRDVPRERAGEVVLGLHLRERRHGPRVAAGRRAVVAGQGLGLVLPARPLPRHGHRSVGPAADDAARRRDRAGRPDIADGPRRAVAGRVRDVGDDAAAGRRDPHRHAGRRRADARRAAVSRSRSRASACCTTPRSDADPRASPRRRRHPGRHPRRLRGRDRYVVAGWLPHLDADGRRAALRHWVRTPTGSSGRIPGGRST